MEVKFEVKTLVVGIFLGVVIVMALGVERSPETGRPVASSLESAYRTDYAISIIPDGMALVRIQNGDFFLVNPKSGMASRVLHNRRLSEEPTRSNRDSRGRQLNYTTSGPLEEAEGAGGYGK